MPAKSWIQYWNQDTFWKDSALWRVNAALFLKHAEGILNLRTDDEVLTIGSGPGYLEEMLAPKVRSILALDTSENFVQRTQQRCARNANVEVRLLGSDYTNLVPLQKKFSLILAVSTVQYYRSLEEVEKLIRSSREVSRPGTRLLIADLPLQRTRGQRFLDALATLSFSVQEGHTPELLRTFFDLKAHGQEYKKASAAFRELAFSLKDLSRIIQPYEPNAKILRKSLSIHANRPSLLIQF